MSNLTALELIQENSQATPGLWNQRYSVISANLAALNSDLTLNSPSGNTFSILTNLETSGGAHVQFLSVGSTPPSYVTTAAITVRVNSSTSDYLYLTDSSALRSSYVVGSRAGGTGDGLNLWDASAGTMIASFSKQSVRFWQTVIGPLIDTGGAVFNVKSYGAKGDASTDDTGSIRLAEGDAELVGGDVFFPPGTYSISSTLRISNHSVRWISVGGATIKSSANLNGDLVSTTPSGVLGSDGTVLRNIRFVDLTLDGNQANQVGLPTNAVTLRLDHVQRCAITGCTFLNGYYAVINCSHAREVLVTGNILAGFRGSGVLCSWRPDAGDTSTFTSRDFVVEGNFINADRQQTVAGNGVFFAQYADSTAPGPSFDTQHAILNCDVVGNTVLGCNDTGIEFSIGMINGTLTGNVIDGSGQTLIGGAVSSSGILINDCAMVSCFGNTIRNYASGSTWTQDGIGIFNRGLGSASLFPRQIAIVGNSVTGVPQYGIGLKGNVTDVLIAGNVAVSNGSADVFWANSGNTNTYFGYNWFGTGSPRGPLLGATHAARFIANAATVFETGNAASTGYAMRTAAGTPPAIEVIAADASAYTNLRAAAFFAGNAGIATLPAYALSEVSLGWYRSAVSSMGLSYGTVDLSPGNSFVAFGNSGMMIRGVTAGQGIRHGAGSPAAVEIVAFDASAYANLRAGAVYVGNAGSAVLPEYSSSEKSLGWYVSASSTMALSYGTLRAPANISFGGQVVGPNSGLLIGGTSAGQAIRHASGTPAAVEVVAFDASAYAKVRASAFYAGDVGLATLPEYSSSEVSLGWYKSGVSTLALSYGTLNLATQAVRLSMRTLAASSVTASAAKTNVAVNEVVFTIGGASGASLIIYSGGTAYGFNSAFSAAAS